MSMRLRIFLLFLLFPIFSFAEKLEKTIYINSGYYNTFNSDSFPAIAFNNDSIYNQQNTILNLNADDTLIIKIINKDSLTHGFAVKKTIINHTISPSDSIIDTLHLTEGIHIYYDSFQNFSLLGGAGIIKVGMNGNHNYFWNIKEFEKTNNEAIINNQPVDLNNYQPNYFEVNGKSKKELGLDPNAYIAGAVDDTINIFIANTGNAIHSIHFHGYHCKIINSSKPTEIGRIKDTFAFFPMEAMVLQLIPDKPGLYPVHDHNLIALAGDKNYPNGIFMMIDIAP